MQLDKVHPNLADKLSTMDPDTKIKYMVKLRSLSPSILADMTPAQVKEALKAHAKATQAPVIAYIEERGGTVLNTFWLINLILVEGPAWLAKDVTRLSIVEEVVDVFNVTIPDVKRHERGFEPHQIYEWNVERVRAPECWAMGITGAGIRVGVSDTGYDITHPDLDDDLFTIDPTSPYYPGGWMEFDSDGNPVLSTPHDTHGHGSHVSGTITGENHSGTWIGIAPDAMIMHALALPGGSGTFPQVLAAMEWKIDPYYIDPDTGEIIYTGLPAHVTSMSWGGSMYYSHYFYEIVRNTLLCGVVPVAAAGNSGEGYVVSPGAVWGVFAAGATDMYDDVPWWSSGGVIKVPDYFPPPEEPEEWPFFPPYPSEYIKPDFSAPGVYVKSSVPWGWEYWSGTSMATPHISATIALMLQAAALSPALTPEVIYEILRDTAVDFGDPGQDTRYGWGRIDAFEAASRATAYALTGIHGVLYDSVTGEPVANAKVTVLETGDFTYTNETGHYSIGVPGEGNWTLRFEKYGYFDYQQVVEVIILNGTVQGWVTNSLTGEPIENATIFVEELNLTFYTDENGFYNGTVKAGLRTLICSKEGYSTETATVFIPEEEVVVVNFTLVPTGNGTLCGTVTDAETGAPISYAFVSAYNTLTGESFSTLTALDGSYSMNVSAGIYVMAVWPPKHYTKMVWDIIVLPSETVTVDFEVTPAPPNLIALYGDYDYQLYDLLTAEGWLVDYFPTVEDAFQILLNITAYSVVAWPGGGTAGLVEEDVFYGIVGLGQFYGVSFVWADSWWTYSYGIYHLVEYLGNPAWRDYDWGEGDVYYEILVDHPIFAGVGGAGDIVYIIWGGWEDHAWFGDYGGDVIANLGTDYMGIRGAGVGVQEFPAPPFLYASRWALLASLAPQEWTNVPDWYDAAKQIWLNAVEWCWNMSWATQSPSPSGSSMTLNTDLSGLFELLGLRRKLHSVSYGESSGLIKPMAWTWFEAYITPMLMTAYEGPVGSEITLQTSGAMPNATIYVYFNVTYPEPRAVLLGTTMANETSGFEITFTVPEAPYGVHYVWAIDPATGQDGLVDFFIIPSVDVPEKAVPGEMITAAMYGFHPDTWLVVSFEDMFMTQVLADMNGSYTANIFVPQVLAGTYKVKAFEPYVPEVGAYDEITVLDVEPLDVDVEVGSIHFRGELAEFYVLTSFKGEAVNATITNAILYYEGGTKWENLTGVVSQIATGLYRIPYTIPTDAPDGTYVLVVAAKYVTETVMSTGISFTRFLISSTLSGWNAILTSVQGDIGLIKTDIGHIKMNLTAINATLIDIQGDIATLDTTLGEIQAKLDALAEDVETILSILGEWTGGTAAVAGYKVLALTTSELKDIWAEGTVVKISLHAPEAGRLHVIIPKALLETLGVGVDAIDVIRGWSKVDYEVVDLGASYMLVISYGPGDYTFEVHLTGAPIHRTITGISMLALTGAAIVGAVLAAYYILVRRRG
ncbi:hypothetical protein DRO60_02180 [Candidatus Bathyarchaeota archaeon]|nr:MAG: hypothetical protein DRO60_02180 [Candidatus Bathyarchaeota archaeon]